MNKTIISKIILAVIILSLVFVLAGCSADGSNVGQAISEIFSTLVMVLFGFIASILSAIITLLAGVLILVAGIFGALGQLINLVWQFFAGLF